MGDTEGDATNAATTVATTAATGATVAATAPVKSNRNMIIAIVCCCVCVCIISSVVGLLMSINNNKPSNSLVLPGYEIDGYALPNGTYENQESAADCDKLCKKNSLCQWFGYNNKTKKCVLKRGNASMNSGDVLSFKLNDGTYSSYPGFTISDASLDAGSDYSGISFDECKAKCKESPTCKIYKYASLGDLKSCNLRGVRSKTDYTYGNIDIRESITIS